MKKYLKRVFSILICISVLFSTTAYFTKAEENVSVEVIEYENIQNNENETETISVEENDTSIIVEETEEDMSLEENTEETYEMSTFDLESPYAEEGYRNKIAVGKYSTGYISSGGEYVSVGNETVGADGINNENDKFEPVYYTLPDGEKVVDIEKGMCHTLILTENGRLFSMGNNECGQLGNGTYVSSNVPIEISQYFNGERIVQISADGWQSFAVTYSGKLYGWGQNNYNQVYYIDSVYENNQWVNHTLPIYNVPTQIHQFYEGIKQIEAGGFSTFLITKTNKVYAWGYGTNGNLGSGTCERGRKPVDITDMFDGETIVEISAGKQHALALTESGKVYAWGYNNFKQVANSEEFTYSTPIELSITSANRVVAGGYSSLVFLQGGVSLWGDNKHRQLGIYENSDEDTFQIYDIITGISDCAIGVNHSVFVTDDNKLKIYTTGRNTNGQLFVDTETKYSDELTYVSTKLIKADRQFFVNPVETNKEFTLLGRDDITLSIKQVYNNETTLADMDDFIYSSSNSDILRVDKDTGEVTVIDEGEASIYALWKENSELISISNYEESKNTIVKFDFKIVKPKETLKTGGKSNYYLTEDGRLFVWGSNDYGQLGTGDQQDINTPREITSSFPETIKRIQSGYGHAVVLTETGRVFTFGINDAGQLGDGTTIVKLSPVEVTGFSSPVKEIYADANHNFALCYSGEIYAWGNNKYGQLGDGTKINRLTPVNITSQFSSEEIKDIIPGGYCTYAITNLNNVYAWGYGAKGNLGDGKLKTSVKPVNITDKFDGEKIKEISAGEQHAIALTTGGKAYVWGYNNKYQLGVTESEIISEPVFLRSKISKVSAGANSTGFITFGGEIYVFGANNKGQLGIGNFSSPQAPVNVTAEILGVSETILFGENFSIVKTKDNRFFTVGNNLNGQFGNGTNNDSIWFIEITDKIFSENVNENEINNTSYTFDCEEGNDYVIVISLTNVPVCGKEFYINYNKNLLSLADICAITPKEDTEIGQAEGTRIHLIYHNEDFGRLRFIAEEELSETQRYTGIINAIKFRAKATGNAFVNIEIVNKEIK